MKGREGLTWPSAVLGTLGSGAGDSEFYQLEDPPGSVLARYSVLQAFRPRAYMKLFGIPFLTESARVDIRVSTVILPLATTPVFFLFFLNTCLRSFRHIFLVIHPSGAWCYTYRVSRRAPWGSIFMLLTSSVPASPL